MKNIQTINEFFFDNKSPITIKKGEPIIAKRHGSILCCLVLDDVHENNSNIKVLIIGLYTTTYRYPDFLTFKLFDHSKSKILMNLGTYEDYVPSQIKIPNVEYTNEGKYPRQCEQYAMHTYQEEGTYMKLTNSEKELMLKEFENNRNILSQIEKKSKIVLDIADDYFIQKDANKFNL